MANILIVYASLTGNTEEIAELIAEGVQNAGHTAVLKSAENCNADEMLNYDGTMIGLYTWGDGDLPDEFLDFYDELDEVDLSGYKVALFGSGDTSYDLFCGAVDTAEAKLKERGAIVTEPSLKIEYSPLDEEKKDCRALGERFAGILAHVS
ncbi:flavodoxin [Paenibacillus shunpengii]|uniref:Flavodoxin n=1 Tax=Paenibacillus shunpengii TaxID=2054424 RepID=A0ABW5SPA3_9BACL|nr:MULTISPECIES: flavodoxin [unclassified Paenibacillus]OMC68474.1 flavodoxin [Paenibacillus sp. FSL H7-0326]SDW60954.1 flavodoxin I [Paenibacillus sp. PDC88]